MVRVVVALLALLLVPSLAQAEKRVVLVIGNGSYANVSKLPNPPRDAGAMEALFRAAGFDLVVAQRDLGATAMRRALRDFSDQVRDADIAVVFYAGHGIEVNGTNYLIPVDAVLERDIDVEDETVSLERVTQILEQARRLRLVVLDACRDNPFVRSMKRTIASRSIGRGLAEVRVLTADTLIAFAAKAGSTAADGMGTNSPYTTALVAHLTTPGLDLRLALGRVRDAVLKSTSNRQEPFVYGSLGGAEIPLVVVRISEATQEWSRVDKTSMAELETFVRRHASSPEAEYARARMGALTQPVVIAEPPKPKPATVSPPAPTGVCDGVEVAVGAAERKCVKPGAGKSEWFKDCPECPEMVIVPAGEFAMGSPKNEKDRSTAEDPQHKVLIGEPFAVGRFAVTREQCATFVRDTNHTTEDKCLIYENGEWEEWAGRSFRNPGFVQEDRHPVVCVSWGDANAFAAWLSKKTSKRYRLLTDAEREYASRGGTKTPFWWGSSISTAQANYDGNYAYGGGSKGEVRKRTVAVDSFKANSWDLYNVHGNVWEWVEDCWHENYRGAPTNGSAWTTGECNRRVLRGGSWDSFPHLLRAATRVGDKPINRSIYIGFRVARTLE